MDCFAKVGGRLLNAALFFGIGTLSHAGWLSRLKLRISAAFGACGQPNGKPVGVLPSGFSEACRAMCSCVALSRDGIELRSEASRGADLHCVKLRRSAAG
jgi:hypothetical protein